MTPHQASLTLAILIPMLAYGLLTFWLGRQWESKNLSPFPVIPLTVITIISVIACIMALCHLVIPNLP